MSLAIGSQLGHFEITAALGSGGMGEVYRARDKRLDRTVAIKVLRADLAGQPALRQRFEREARAVSALNHPHICALYDIGSQDGVEYLVMELLEGETLLERLKKGPLPFELALRTAIQITDALSRAHAQQVVHRDLKPANVMLTKSGAKLLDFGLAKVGGVIVGGGGLSTRESPQLTQEGTLLGTLQYMAPEQLHGKEADARADLFSFGALLYEMLSGECAFQGESSASVIAAILNTQPRALSELQPVTPPALERAVKRCLAKEPDDRWQNARDLMHELEWILANPVGTSPQAARSSRGRRVASLAAIAVAFGLGLAFSFLRPPGAKPPARPVKLSLPRPLDAPFLYFESSVISPDGQRVVFIGYTKGEDPKLWVRSLDDDAPKPLEGTENASRPFWSPDSRHLAFLAFGKLQRIEGDGGPVQTICEVGDSSGGTWGPDGTIIVNGSNGGLMRVPATGGTPVPATRLLPSDEAHRWPCFLPDGKHFIFLSDSERTENHKLKLGSLNSLETTELVQAVSNAVYAAPGFLLYVRSGNLLAQHWDQKTLSLAGDPVTIAPNIVPVEENHHFDFSASTNGILTFRSADTRAQLAWLDRQGLNPTNLGEPGHYGEVSMSTDANVIAFGQDDLDGRAADIWSLDLHRGAALRVTTGPAADFGPVLAPDGDRIAFGTYLKDGDEISLTRISQPGERKLLLNLPAGGAPLSWTADSRSVIYREGTKLFVVAIDDAANPKQLTAADAEEDYAQLSADGHWLAYMSTLSGREEIFVQPYPSGKRVQISSKGGWRARWRADGRELIYFSQDHHVFSVGVTAGDSPEFKPPVELFDLRGGDFWGITPDGARLLVTKPVEDPLDVPLSVVIGWDKGL